MCKKLPPRELSRSQVVPRKIDGLNTDVVESGVFRMLTHGRQGALPAGDEHCHYKSTAGTLGAVVKDRKTGN